MKPCMEGGFNILVIFSIFFIAYVFPPRFSNKMYRADRISSHSILPQFHVKDTSYVIETNLQNVKHFYVLNEHMCLHWQTITHIQMSDPLKIQQLYRDICTKKLYRGEKFK